MRQSGATTRTICIFCVMLGAGTAIAQGNGPVVAWGNNMYGECDVPEPNAGFIAVAGGWGHSLGLKADGTVVAWGKNEQGQCSVPEPNADFVAIAAGMDGGAFANSHSLGLKSDGSVVAWGPNDSGELDVPEPNTDFVAIAAGVSCSLGLKSDGTIVAWGDNFFGQSNLPEPNAGFAAISMHCLHGLGLKSDGTIVGWGWNGSGQCNVPEPNYLFTAAAAGCGHSLGLRLWQTIEAWGDNSHHECEVPEPNDSFISVCAGGYHSLGLRSDGTVAAWGYNDQGQCNVPEPNMGFTTVAAGQTHSLAIRGCPQLPAADAGGPYYGGVGETIAFDGSGSCDSDGEIVLYEWKWFEGDMWHEQGGTPTHMYDTAGWYEVSLRATDDDGGVDVATTTAVVGPVLPVPVGGLSVLGTDVASTGPRQFLVTGSVSIGDAEGSDFPFFLGETSQVSVDLDLGTVDVVFVSGLELHHQDREFLLTSNDAVTVNPSLADPQEASIAFHGSLHGEGLFSDFGVSGDISLRPNHQLLDVSAASFFGVDELFPSETLASFDGSIGLSQECTRLGIDGGAENTSGIRILGDLVSLPFDQQSEFRFRIRLDLANRLFEILFDESLLEIVGTGGGLGLGCFPFPGCGGIEVSWDDEDEIRELTIVKKLDVGFTASGGGRDLQFGGSGSDDVWIGQASQGFEDVRSADGVVNGSRIWVPPVGINMKLKGREVYTDENCNGTYDLGEAFQDDVIGDGVWTDGSRLWLDDYGLLNMDANAELDLDLLYFIHVQVAQIEAALDWAQQLFEFDVSGDIMMGPSGQPWFVLSGVGVPDAYLRVCWHESNKGVAARLMMRPSGPLQFWEVPVVLDVPWADGRFQQLTGEFLSGLVPLDFLSYELAQVEFECLEDGMRYEANLSFPAFSVGTSATWRSDLFEGRFVNDFSLLGFEIIGVESIFAITPECLYINALVSVLDSITVPMGFLWCDGWDSPIIDTSVSFAVACPADLHFYDTDGRHIGREPGTGDVEIGIPGGVYLESADGEAKYISVPALDLSADNRLVVDSYGEGVFSLDVLYPDPDAGHASHAVYREQPLQVETQAELILSGGRDFTLRIDSDGDGVDDLFAQPDTLAQACVDTGLIRIVCVDARAGGLAHDATAEVIWTTNVPATSSVLYGLGTAYTDTVLSTDPLSVSHSVTLAGLDPDTTYHFMAVSTDSLSRTARSPDFTFTWTDIWAGVEEQSEGFGSVLASCSVLPNPNRGRVEIQFEMAHAGEVAFTIYDAAGRLIWMSPKDSYSLGKHSLVVWDSGLRGRRLTNGVYFLSIRSGGRHVRRKFVVVR